MSRKMVVIQHDGNHETAAIEASLASSGWEVENISLSKGEHLPAGLENVGGLLILGGPINVYEQYTNPLQVYMPN